MTNIDAESFNAGCATGFLGACTIGLASWGVVYLYHHIVWVP